MKLVSTTMTGNAQDTIADTIRSVVDVVDACILVDTGITDGTIDAAKKAAGDKLCIRTWLWRNDFAAARNACARYAAETGADWQIFVDSDERLLSLDRLRDALETSDMDYYLVTRVGGESLRERVFHMPLKGRWSGPTHEAYCDGGRHALLPNVLCSERDKTPAQLTAKYTRDRNILVKHVARYPGDPRYWYYLGDCHAFFRDWHKAIRAFDTCTGLKGWPEEGAWACYRAAICWVELGQLDRAVDACTRGLAVHAGVAELAWYAAWCRAQQGNTAQAIAWANMSRANGLYSGDGSRFGRIGFRHLPALYEGPYDVLRFALPEGPDRDAAGLEYWRALTHPRR